MLYVQIPESLLQLYSKFQASLISTVAENITAQMEYTSITVPTLLYGYPKELLFAQSVGGNILCGNDLPSTPSAGDGMLTFFGTKNTCHCYFSDYIVPKLGEILFALLALNTQEELSASDISEICSCDAIASSSCSRIYKRILSFGLSYTITLSPPLIKTAQDDMTDLNVQVVQFLTTNSSNPIDLFVKQLVSPNDRVYSFYGWCMLYEWASGLRDVVTFEGDSGAITTISTRNDPWTISTLDDTMPQALSYLFQCCAQYVTSVLIGVATLIIAYALIHRGNLEGLNLFELNRIVGHVWIGRTFLIFRSITAMWLLNTNTLELEKIGFVTFSKSPPLAWYKNILAAGESTWLVYVLNDILSCITLQYTSYYATKSALLVWFIVACWTLASPQQVYSVIDRTCNYINMDQGLICSSGYVQIGSLSRLLGVVGICFGSITLCYIIERLRQPQLSRLNIPTQLLNSQSYYLLDFTHWVHGDKYFLDATSALMAGIVTLHTPNYFYVLDVKSWRYFFVESSKFDHMLTSNGQHDRMSDTIPLSSL
ncbi:hypothetical protein THRCLA_10728 [Thraustotheca clavata]|uniref:Transmembrane protein n=1 Tax=Thraustotheca clavata TaxID=74557 RepID=A0A1V9YHV2_9STRA|nr:hypothetical protein THRCLA_10728 [Thraustotheca clavata]